MPICEFVKPRSRQSEWGKTSLWKVTMCLRILVKMYGAVLEPNGKTLYLKKSEISMFDVSEIIENPTNEIKTNTKMRVLLKHFIQKPSNLDK
uniref:Uncharacterized protein n=1 Tax=Romanomermis culicivorax TaxID=13658 RepID=A0A915ILV1_ROMCU